MGVRSFASGAGAKSTQEDDDDLDDGFSELETPVDSADGDDDLAKSDLSEEEDLQTELEALGDVAEKISSKKRGLSAMTKTILDSPSSMSLSKVLDEWVGEGNEVNQTEAALTMLHLRKRRLFGKALEFSEWLESRKHFEFSDKNYASRVDLIAKSRGIYKAENYISKIPQPNRGELVYRTLLANCVSANHVKKAEETFNKMKTLGLPITCFSCNQLLLLYKRTDKKKIADILLLMEKENIKPSAFTYQILIDVKGQSNDIPAMEQVVAQMKADGVELNTQIQASMARHYAEHGIKDKAEAILKEIEGESLEKNRWACHWLMPIYASLGQEDQVERIWKVCEENPRVLECLTAIKAWGQLKKIEKAEEAFEQLSKKVKKPNSKHFTALLRVYADHGLLAKGKELVRRMGESGCQLGPLTWDAIVKLYLGAGEVEKADSVLGKAVGGQKKGGKPLFSTYLAIMEGYAGRGDVHNAEKILTMMRRVGYLSRLKQYKTLVEAYVKAGKPAYGMSDRLKADGVFPNRVLGALLAKVDPFRKTPVSDLLE
ncbi:Pentatricopeptide repeat-containing protein -mitochondrial [Striga hermonthica]|uniref:Pentatricopeptide repeat-containing protein -mitochondrial n=1 Tax=Striga hermonthica TaxID=68872 RepID=A0A9N7MRS4_STRHE|nr:Pentatricopeptide repeat-containing protein -mitochondrial [Striga hermonthica]